MRSMPKFVSLAGGMLLLLAAVHVLTGSVSRHSGGWAGTEQMLWVCLADQLAAGITIIAIMIPLQSRRGRIPVISLAVGLVGMTVVEIVGLIRDPAQAMYAQGLSLALALALAAAAVRTKQRGVLCAAAAAVRGALVAAGAWYAALSVVV